MHDSLVDWAVDSDVSVLNQEDFINVQDYERRLKELKAPTSKPKPEKGGQSPVCAIIPEDTRNQMIKMVRESYDEGSEMGMAIRNGFELGPESTGSERDVTIIRPPDTIGTYHTHVHSSGIVQPGHQDILESLDKQDSVLCVGSYLPMSGTKINCFTPVEPLWSEYNQRMSGLLGDLRDYYQDARSRYDVRKRKIRALSLKKLLKYIADPSYLAYVGSLRPQDMTLLLTESALKLERANKLEDAVITANQKAKQAKDNLYIAQRDFDAATDGGDDEIKSTGILLQDAKELSERMQAQSEINRKIAADAEADAEIARIKASITPGDLEKGRENARWAEQHLRKGAELEIRRRNLLGDIDEQVHLSSYKQEWRPVKDTLIQRCNLVGGSEEDEEDEELPFK
ncbi:MAG: hypothetical protein KJ820_16330 [Bacteroidetes bacterium]|nr:hypothetical protein [Bacteroidota bacterium]